MNTTILILFFIGIILSIIGYYKIDQHCPINKIKYKYISKNIQEEQAYPESVYEIYKKMFTGDNIRY